MLVYNNSDYDADDYFDRGGEISDVKVVQKGDSLLTYTPKNYDFIRTAHNYNARWNRWEKYWKFSIKDKEAVMSALKDIYGYDGENMEVTPEKISDMIRKPAEIQKENPEDVLKNPMYAEFYALVMSGINQMILNPPKQVTLDNVWTWDSRKSQYAYLPPKRKRPDYLTIAHVFDMMCRALLKKGIVIPLTKLFENKYFHSRNLETFNRLIKEFPQLTQSEDHDELKALFEEAEKELRNKFDIWNRWKKEHLNPGQTVYIRAQDGFHKGTIGSLYTNNLDVDFNNYDYPDSVEGKYGNGYIMFAGKRKLTNIYLENPQQNPNAKNVVELFGYPEELKDESKKENQKESKRQKIDFLKNFMFDEKHPLMILDNDSPQWNSAYNDFLSEVQKYKTEKQGEWKLIEKFNGIKEYTEFVEKDTDKKILELSENEIIASLGKLPIESLAGIEGIAITPAETKEGRMDKIAQMLIYHAAKGKQANELTLEQYAIRQFITSARAESAMLSEALYVPVEDYKKAYEEQNSKLSIVQELENKKNEIWDDVKPLTEKRKELYSDADITTPKSIDEKNLDREISEKYSESNQIIKQIREIKKDVELEDEKVSYKKDWVKLKNLWSEYKQGTIGKILKRPNMFVTMVNFGKDRYGKELNEKVDNNYLEFFAGDVKTVSDDKGEHYEFTDIELETKTEPKMIIKDAVNIASAVEEKKEIKTDKDIWINGNYYQLYPQKVLGTPKKMNSKGNPYTDMRGNEITKYEGSFELLDLMDLPELEVIPQEAPAPAIVEQTEPEAKENDELLLEKSKEEIVTAVKQRKVKKVNISTSGRNDAELLSAREIFEKYNPKISQDELESFLWYQYVNGDMWQGYFQQLFDPSVLTESEKEAHLRKWIENGVLFYMKGELLPKVIYLSDNVYLRKQYLQEDKKIIIERYGQEVFDNQMKEIEIIFKQVYDKRLLLDADEDKRLKFPPTHELARIIKIETLDDEKRFVGTAFRDNQANAKKNVVGQIDFSKDTGGYRSYGMKDYESLNLKDAFIYWMKLNKNTINFKRGTSWEEIYHYYINNKKRTKDVDKEEFNKIKSRARAEGDRLFSYFLANHIKASDKIKIETIFNQKLNSYISPDYEKIPVAFSAGKYYPGNKQLEIRPEKRSNVAFMVAQGSGLIPDGVGFGKTWSGIMAMAQKIEIGHALRPVMVVPNQTYKQWISETKGILPHVKINDLYNLSESYLNELYDENNNVKKVPANSITFLTYEGMERIGFRGANELYGYFEGHDTKTDIHSTSAYQLYKELFEILQQGTIADAKDANSLRQKVLFMLGFANKNTVVDIEDLGFDFIGFDEAHALKKIFTRVVSNDEDKESKYAISSGSPSATAIKGFGLSHYILKNNKQRNIMLLTATPITNSPLEVYSILSLIAYKQMSEGFVFDDNVERKLNNVVNFFDNFAEVTNDFVFTATMKFERRDIFIGWKNLTSLQRLLYRYSNYKKPESVPIVRPDKIELPMPEGAENRINSILPLTPLQQFIMKNVVMYAEGTISYEQLKSMDFMPEKSKVLEVADIEEEESDTIENEEGESVDENSLSDEEKKGVRLLRSVNMNRSIALSPYLLRLEDAGGTLRYALGRPTYKEYVESSTKLKFTMDMVKMMKEYYESRNEPVSGQLIYMDRGKEFFPLVKEYLVKEIGFKEHEIGMIYSGMKSAKGVSSKDAKQYVQNKFLGIDYDKETGVVVNIPDEERMKVLIGSSSMREGMNLQKHSIALYDLFPAWNPTDRIQLLGRIHRQGNKHRYCFVITPLMINSIDIFMMQKLQEKTLRINAIWDLDGQTNVLDVKDFDPEQIKYELIENPEVIAKIEIEDLQVRMKDDLSSMKAQIETCQKIKEDFATIDRYKDDLKNIVDTFRPPQVFKDGTVQDRKIETLLMKLDEIAKEQTDADGKRFESYGEFDWQKWSQYRDNQKFKNLTRSYSNNRLYFELPHWYENFKSSLYYINRKAKEKEIYSDPNLLTKEIERLNSEIEKIDKEMQHLNSPEYLSNRTQIVREIKAEKEITTQSSDEIIQEFKKQFSDKFSEIRVDEETKAPSLEELIAKMPVMTSDGLYSTDQKTIEELEAISEKMQQTEELYTDEYGNFKPERKELHERIKADIRRNVLCITPQEKPIAVITGGLPGSGKTFFLKKYAPYMNDESILKIDADSIRAKLPEYRGWNASATHKESSRLVSEILEEVGTPCVTDILYDGTMNKSKNYKPLINQLKRLGYRTFIIFLDIPLNVARERVLKRYSETGRYVPMYVLENSAKVDKSVYDELKSMVDGYMTVDGITGQIKEQKGEQLPHDRFWFREDRYKKDQSLINYARELKDAMFEAQWIDVKEKGGKITKYGVNQPVEFYDGWGKEKTGHITAAQYNDITNEQFYWINKKYLIPESNIIRLIDIKKNG